MDCLPEASEWSAQSQYAMVLDHLQAMRQHLQTLEAAPDALALVAQMPQLEELNARCLEAHDLLKALSQQTQNKLQNLKQNPENNT